jgi:hypothetical protein
MRIWHLIKHTFRYLCLKAAGHASLYHTLGIQKVAIEHLQTLKGVETVVCESDLVFDKELNAYKLRMFFYMPNDTLNSVYLDTYCEMHLQQTQRYLEKFNEEHAKKKLAKVLKIADYVRRDNDGH